MKKNKIIDRLDEFMEYKGLNDNRITHRANLSIGLIGRARKNKKGIHTNTLEKILTAFPELNPTWLLLGKENMLMKSDNNKENTNKYTNEDLFSEIFNTQREIIIQLKKSILKT